MKLTYSSLLACMTLNMLLNSEVIYKERQQILYMWHVARLKYLRLTKKLQYIDGLNSLSAVNVRVEKLSLYTWVYVTVNKQLLRQQTRDFVKHEYQKWKERQSEIAQKEESRAFKVMPSRDGPRGFEDIPLQAFEIDKNDL